MSITELEQALNLLYILHAIRLKETKIVEWAINLLSEISDKLRALRFAGLIDNETYNNLKILFNIRNTFAHEGPNSVKFDLMLNKLEDISINNHYPSLKRRKNNAKKFEIISYFYFSIILKYIEKNYKAELSQYNIKRP